MELRDFFSEKEINTMKERIIRETCLSRFLVRTEYKDEDGSKQVGHCMSYEIESIIRDETVKQVKEYVKQIVNEVAKERVSKAVDKFSDNLCDQLGKIAEKTNWHWSIKS